MKYTRRAIAKALAIEEAEGCGADSVMELLLEGCEGYVNWTLTDLVERFVNNGHSPDCEPDLQIVIEDSGHKDLIVVMEDGRFSHLATFKSEDKK
jgi:hypothetical protein